MSLPIMKRMDFGIVEQAGCGHVNMGVAPDFFCFKMNLNKAKPLLKRMNAASAAIENTLQKFDSKNREPHRIYYRMGRGEDRDTVLFTAYLLEPVVINRALYAPEDAVEELNRIDEQEARHFHVICDFAAEGNIEENLLLLRLSSLNVVD